jgi:hypothetical protein
VPEKLTKRATEGGKILPSRRTASVSPVSRSSFCGRFCGLEVWRVNLDGFRGRRSAQCSRKCHFRASGVFRPCGCRPGFAVTSRLLVALAPLRTSEASQSSIMGAPFFRAYSTFSRAALISPGACPCQSFTSATTLKPSRARKEFVGFPGNFLSVRFGSFSTMPSGSTTYILAAP